jgi:hypothetical protein
VSRSGGSHDDNNNIPGRRYPGQASRCPRMDRRRRIDRGSLAATVSCSAGTRTRPEVPNSAARGLPSFESIEVSVTPSRWPTAESSSRWHWTPIPVHSTHLQRSTLTIDLGPPEQQCGRSRPGGHHREGGLTVTGTPTEFTLTWRTN